MRLYLLACGFLLLSAFVMEQMGQTFHGSSGNLHDIQLWMPITIALSILGAMVSVGAEVFMFTVGAETPGNL